MGILGVNATGDVIYVAPGGNVLANNGTSIAASGHVVLGQDVNQTGNPGQLLSNREVPMNDHNIVFTDNAATNPTANRIGIGTSAPAAKVDILLDAAVPGTVTSTGLRVTNMDLPTSAVAVGEAIVVSGNNKLNEGLLINVSNSDISRAIWATATGTGSTTAVRGDASGGSGSTSINRGVDGRAQSTPSIRATQNYGVSGFAQNGIENLGGSFAASTTSSTISTRIFGVVATASGGVNGQMYGIHATASNTIGSQGRTYAVYGRSFNTANPGFSNNYAAYFNGRVHSTTNTYTSDSIFKENVVLIPNAMTAIRQLAPRSYTFNQANYPQMDLPQGLQYGFVAQEVERVLPDVVHGTVLPATFDSTGNVIYDETKFLSLDYNAMIPLNTKGIQELDQRLTKVERSQLSDVVLKTEINNLTGSLQKVLDMRGVSYNWDVDNHPELTGLPETGFIAQEINAIDPELTFVDENGYMNVRYDRVVPILAESVEELNNKLIAKDSLIDSLNTVVEDLNERLTRLENCLSSLLPTLCEMNQSAIQANTPELQELVRKQLSVVLSNRNAIILNQNVPNPFAEQTVINFSIPESVVKAQIHFYSFEGKLMQSVDITDRGLGSLTVFGSDLSSGTYTYTLVADGKVVATKKMMKQ